MGAGYRKRELRAGLAALLLVAALSGCASSSSYAGISLRSGAADRDLQELAMRARSGDKHAQLELGIRYEEGRGVPRRIEWAEKLHSRAAANSGGVVWPYSPPVGAEKQGRLIPLDTGIPTPGLSAARERLRSIRAGSGR